MLVCLLPIFLLQDSHIMAGSILYIISIINVIINFITLIIIFAIYGKSRKRLAQYSINRPTEYQPELDEINHEISIDRIPNSIAFINMITFGAAIILIILSIVLPNK